MFNMKNRLISVKTMCLSTSSLMLSAVILITGKSNSYPWERFGGGLISGDGLIQE